ncbi:MAG: 4Fe-4S dicluster domain-containing protein [Halanaerobiaceae bacterium]|nr:4Fe-4S dicluster domain-containing protein [Halanaerobiaceae bacterium]
MSKKLCKQCNLCIKFCPRGVLKTDNKGFPIAKHPEKCNGCFVCFLRCPDFALEVNQNDK